ncbi:MAG TPA: pseudouridine synthase [Gemmatimonadota bacterium]|nr:pseudouridine synthase [Gemmatimonadota bacterium]
MSQEGERLQKVLARAGLGSRRAVEEMIQAGRIAVNGTTARLGQRVDPSKDKVEVDGSGVPLDVDLVHYLLNKPTGVVTTADDPTGRPTVLDLVELPARVWPAGRLDIDSEGALILTNDGELSHRLTHPSFEVPKTYVVKVGGSVSERSIRALARGVELEDGRTRPAKVTPLDRSGGSTLVEITITEGRNRQVRRMFDAVGHRVLGLVRTAIGPLKLGHLKPGSVRKLSPAEVRSLYRATGL